MNKLFSIRALMGVLIVGIGLFGIGVLMVDWGLFKNVLGVCVPRCPSGALCAMMVRNCSEGVGEFLKRGSPLFVGSYLGTYILVRFLYGRKRIKS